MHARTVERVESWNSRPFSDGVRDLRDLAADDFSGAAVADGAWLFMLNGRVVGVSEGDVEDFEDASGTVYEAPHPSLPLLFSMQERGGETQAKYYTNDTPLSEVDDTLTDGNFTGYVELSENVLSGDYYVVYYGGRSMSAAFVGASEELVAGDEAFELANDEVGVYEVCKTPVNVTHLPDGDEDASTDARSGGSATADSPAAGRTHDDPAAETTTADVGTDDAAADPGATQTEANGGTTADADATTANAETTTVDTDAATAEETAPSQPDDEPERPASERGRTADGTSEPSAGRATTNDGTRPDDRRADRSDGTPTESVASTDSGGANEGVFDDEEEWRQARSVPTLDPKQSESSGRPENDATDRSASQRRQQSGSNRGERRRSRNADRASEGTVEKLKRAVRDRTEKLEAANERIESVAAERDDLRGRLDDLREERDELRARVQELEARRETGGGDARSSGVDLEPGAALADTNLFVRYDSKGKPTLDELDGETDADAVNQNLRIEHHTQFDASEASVDGESYESFLTASSAYQFVSWAVRELPYEIRDAGHAAGLSELYGALPRVDRAELGGTVEAEVEEETVSRSFDVVLRDRMGEPLVVADLNDERDAVSGDEMSDLVDAATDVREGADGPNAAMYVTASFFEPRALETASEATDGGGFLSRSDKESYVKVSRRDGFHLCLVEDRNDAFHLTVPEL